MMFSKIKQYLSFEAELWTLTLTQVYFMITNTVMFCFAGRNCEQYACSKDYQPVCASNDKTYRNKCQLLRAQCLIPAITLKYNGTCTNSKEPSPNYS